MSRPHRNRRTMVVTLWPGGETTYSSWLLDEQVPDAVLGRLRHGATVPYIIRCVPKSSQKGILPMTDAELAKLLELWQAGFGPKPTGVLIDMDRKCRGEA